MDFSSLTPLQLGHYGEMLAQAHYEAQGFTVSDSSPYYGDLKLTDAAGDVTFIEVKTIRPNADGRIRATVRKDGSQHLHYANFVLVLVCADGAMTKYLIPAGDITTKKLNLAHYADRIL